MRAALVFLFTLVPLFSQTADTAIFRALLLPGNLVPPASGANRGTLDVSATVVRDTSGQIVSGTLDVLVRTAFAAVANLTAVELRSGAAGQNGAAVLSSTIPRPILNGADAVRVQLQIDPANAAAVQALRGMLLDPARYYLQMTTAEQPNGALRGQLQRAQMVVLMGLLSSERVVPAAPASASGFAQIIAIGTRNDAGNWTTAELYLSAACSSSDATVFNGFHIHTGVEGATGTAVFTAPLLPNLQTNPQAFVAIRPSYMEVAVGTAAQVSALNALFGNNPGQLYIDLHTTGNPNGILRAQLRRTDAMSFPLLLDSTREAHRTSAAALVPARLTLYTLRNEDGSIAAATFLWGLNFRFPGPTLFLGLFIHDGAPAEEGAASIALETSFTAETGFGADANWSAPIYELGVIEDLVKNPESHYLSLHTFDDPAGGARAQFGPAAPARAAVGAVLSATLDKNAATVAPGGLVTIFGTTLAKVATDLSGWSGRRLPLSLNGTSVTIGGIAAPLLYVGPDQINAQVPLELASGTQMVVVDNGGTPGRAFAVNVAATAPAIFFAPLPAVLRNTNFSLVTPANPARAGEAILVYATGLGQTSPALSTGSLAPDCLCRTTTVTARIGDRAASVVYSLATPQAAGFYQVAITVPSGVSGAVPLVLEEAGVASNTVTINVQ